jgi:hypothetical protein
MAIAGITITPKDAIATIHLSLCIEPPKPLRIEFAIVALAAMGEIPAFPNPRTLRPDLGGF